MILKFKENMLEKEVTYSSSELNHGNLHAQTNPKIRNIVFSGIFCSQDHTSHTTISKSTRNQDTSCILQMKTIDSMLTRPIKTKNQNPL